MADQPGPSREVDADPAPVAKLVLRIGRMAHEYGMPAYELDRVLSKLASALGMDAVVVSTPHYLDLSSVDGQGLTRNRLLARLGDVSYDMQRLSRTVRLMNRVVGGEVGVDQANRELDAISSLAPPYSVPLVGAAFAACGAAFAVILSAAWGDVALAAVLSVVVFLIGQAAPRSRWLADRLLLVSAFTAAVLAATVGVLLGQSDSPVVALCAFVVLVPGLGLTLGAYELAAGRTVLGWNRFIKAGVQTFALFAGAAIGSALVRALIGSPDLPDVDPPMAWVQWVFLVLLMVGLVVVFQVPSRQAPWTVAAGLLAYAGLELGSRSGDWQGPFLGSLILGLFGAFFVRVRGHSSPLIVVLPGILILVPGVAAYASLRALSPDTSTGAAASVADVLVPIAAIISGLFVAGSLIDLGRRAPTSPAQEEVDAKESS